MSTPRVSVAAGLWPAILSLFYVMWVFENLPLGIVNFRNHERFLLSILYKATLDGQPRIIT